MRPSPAFTRVLVQDGPIPILKARLPEAPHHPRALDEGLNAIIQGMKKTAQGFRNAEHFKTTIFFYCGG